MKNEKFIQVKDSTWYIDATVSIPVYFLNDREVVLIDSGYVDRDQDLIKAVLEENNLTVKAAIASHCHVDHVGNFQWLRETYGAELIVPEIEKWIISDTAFIAYLYRPVHAVVLEDDVKHMYFNPDRTYKKDDTKIEICGKEFGLVYAPGHTIGHTLIVTPDDVCYLGDAIVCESMLEKSKMLTCNDWDADFKTKEEILKLNYSKYILGHSGLCEDLKALADKNVKRRMELIDIVVKMLEGQDEWTMNEIERGYYKLAGMHANRRQPMSIYRRNLICLIEYLIVKNIVKCDFSEGTMVYSLASK